MLGASRSCISDNARNADARRQLLYLQLKEIAHEVWKEDFGVEYAQVRSSGPVTQDLVENIISSAPFIQSRRYKENVTSALPSNGGFYVQTQFYGKGIWKTLLSDALRYFKQMNGWWLAGRSQKKKNKPLD